jgi:hypothetical protein
MIYVLHQVVRITAFRDVIPCSVVDISMCFGAKLRLHLQGNNFTSTWNRWHGYRKRYWTGNLCERMRPLKRSSYPTASHMALAQGRWRQNVPSNQPIRHHIPENSNRHSHHHENLKSQTLNQRLSSFRHTAQTCETRPAYRMPVRRRFGN